MCCLIYLNASLYKLSSLAMSHQGKSTLKLLRSCILQRLLYLVSVIHIYIIVHNAAEAMCLLSVYL